MVSCNKFVKFSFIFVLSILLCSIFSIGNSFVSAGFSPSFFSHICIDLDHGKLIKKNGVEVCIYSDGSYCDANEYFKKHCRKGQKFLNNSNSSNNNNENNNVDNNENHEIKDYKYVLFAHGMGASKDDWDKFASRAKKKGYKVFRTNVPRCGSVKERAKKLAEYINSLNLPDNSLRIVAHSMGGIDSRYLIYQAHLKKEPFYSAGKKINQIFTLATPNRGSFPLMMGDLHVKTNGCTIKLGPFCLFNFDIKLGRPFDQFVGCGADTKAYHDLTTMNIDNFLTKKIGYSDFKVDDRRVGFLAFRFEEKLCGPSDCVVDLHSQSWSGAPVYNKVFSATHSKDVTKNINNAYNGGCDAACNAQCKTCECRRVDTPFGHGTFCPPNRDQCLRICYECRNLCKRNLVHTYEQNRVDVLDIILNYPMYKGDDSVYGSNTNLALKKGFLMSSEKDGAKPNGDGNNNFEINVTMSANFARYLNKTLHNESVNISDLECVNKTVTKFSNSSNETTNSTNFTSNNVTNHVYKKKLKKLFRHVNVSKYHNLSQNISLSNSFKNVSAHYLKNKSKNLILNNSHFSNLKKRLNGSLNRIKNELNRTLNVSNESNPVRLNNVNKKFVKKVLKFRNKTLNVSFINSSNILIKPEVLLQKIEELKELDIENLSMINKSNNLSYVVKVKEKAKILWFFTTEIENIYLIDAKSGKAYLNSSVPWYVTGFSNLMNFFN